MEQVKLTTRMLAVKTGGLYELSHQSYPPKSNVKMAAKMTSQRAQSRYLSNPWSRKDGVFDGVFR